MGALSVGAERLKTTCGTSYLRTLVCSAQNNPGTDDAASLAAAHATLYPHIVEGVTTDDVKPELAVGRADRKARALERTSRSNFARTAYYAVGRFLIEGGRLDEIDVPNITKATIVASADKLRSDRLEQEKLANPVAPSPVIPPVTASAMHDVEEAINTLLSAVARFPHASAIEVAPLDERLRELVEALDETREEFTSKYFAQP